MRDQRTILQTDPQDTRQHQNGAGEGVKEELDGCVDAPFTAPQADEEVHGDEGEFPEDVKQHHIQGEEHAQHTHFQQQEESHKAFHLLCYRFPGGKDGKGGEEGGEQHHEDADAVDAEMNADGVAAQVEPGKHDIQTAYHRWQH